MEGPERVKLNLKPCRNCGRTFNPESLVKHEKSCKTVNKPRKVFDTSKQRATDDLSLKQIKNAQKKAAAEAQKKQVAPPKSHWRQKHEEFVRNIRAAKQAQVAIDSGGPLPPPPPPSENPDYVTCPYCSRRFNEKAADRHINFCKEQQKRVPAKRVPSQQEQKRAAATKYQPPKPKVRGSPGDSPMAGGGYGSSGSSRGGYSGGAPPRGAPAGVRGTPPGPEMGGRSAGGYSSGSQVSRGRAPAGGAARGRQAPASQGTYANKYGDANSGQNGLMADPLRVLSGRSLKLREDRRPASRDKPSNQNNVLSTNRGAMDGKNHARSANKSSPSSGHNLHVTDSGYHSNSSETDAAVPRIRKVGRPSSGVAKFCHECGTKYPTAQAKFCMECGIRKIEIHAR
ncbi:zinc finger C2HC domain-containing protein 1A-like isoform X2 [Ruditapes philippinarum]|uniref:zinc finger C2HC domain-containing protein 1A-like isoform X2 n=1 Tax=Ruditapes philippinarum TaxID=129788 RepID=UPI00295B0692|nr:zinc finger C2HC domain-containing protein 1A-like isoform X2 [Ruditapes philippinarum]